MNIACDLCSSRGRPPTAADAFPEPCHRCKGAGFVTLAAVAARIEEDATVVKKLIRWDYRGKGTPHKAVALRIFEKLHQLAEEA